MINRQWYGVSIPPSIINKDHCQLSPAMSSEEWQGIPVQSGIIPCPLDSVYILSKHHVFSQESVLAKHNLSFIQAASRKIHHFSVIRKTSSHVIPSAKASSRKTDSRKISHDKTLSRKKCEISSSYHHFCFFLNVFSLTWIYTQ